MKIFRHSWHLHNPTSTNEQWLLNANFRARRLPQHWGREDYSWGLGGLPALHQQCLLEGMTQAMCDVPPPCNRDICISHWSLPCCIPSGIDIGGAAMGERVVQAYSSERNLNLAAAVFGITEGAELPSSFLITCRVSSTGLPTLDFLPIQICLLSWSVSG